MKAEESLSKIEETLTLTTLTTWAQNDDRRAFDQLFLMRYTEGPFQDIAARIVEEVALDVSFEVILSPQIDWSKIGINPQSATLEELQGRLRTIARAIQPGYIAHVWEQDRFTKVQRLQFLYDVMGATNSLRMLQRACLLMNQEAKIGKNFLYAKAYREWWEQNKSLYARREGEGGANP